VRIVPNLLDNAIRHGRTIRQVRFSAEERNGSVVIICEDDGVGIPYDENERVFQRGFGRNTGLGLFLSREILGITGIAIEEIGSPGAGAKFEMVATQGAWRMEGSRAHYKGRSG